MKSKSLPIKCLLLFWKDLSTDKRKSIKNEVPFDLTSVKTVRSNLPSGIISIKRSFLSKQEIKYPIQKKACIKLKCAQIIIIIYTLLDFSFISWKLYFCSSTLGQILSLFVGIFSILLFNLYLMKTEGIDHLNFLNFHLDSSYLS